MATPFGDKENRIAVIAFYKEDILIEPNINFKIFHTPGISQMLVHLLKGTIKTSSSLSDSKRSNLPHSVLMKKVIKAVRERNPD